MDNFIKIKQILALDGDIFFKIKESIYDKDRNGYHLGFKKFWLFAESLGEFKSALYVIDIISNILTKNNDKNKPLFFVSFRTKSTYAIAKKILNSSGSFNDIIYFFHPAGIFKKLSKRYTLAIKPDYFISIEHAVSNNLMNELLKINTRICFLNINSIVSKDIKTRPANWAKYSQTIFITVPDEDKKKSLEKIISLNSLNKFFRITALSSPLKFNTGFYAKNNGNSKNNDGIKYDSGLVISFISIHKNESRFILKTVKKIVFDKDLNKNRDLKFIFVPRNIKISSRLFKIASDFNLKPVYINNINGNDIYEGFLKNNSFKSLIVNNYGSLDDIYPLSDIVYVGKSLYKREGGGHNILEPASFGKAIMTGSHASNFQDIILDMLKNDAVTVITEHDFKNTLCKLINDDKLRQNAGLNALRYYLETRDSSKEALINYLSANFI